MTEEIINQLIEFIKNASPVIWNAFVKQVYLDAAQYIFIGVFALIVAAILLALSKRYYKVKIEKDAEGYNADDETVAMYSLLIIGILVAFLSSLALFEGIKGFLNPDYYAIQNIISQIIQ